MNPFNLSIKIRDLLREVEESGGELNAETLARVEALSENAQSYANNLTAIILREQLDEQKMREQAAIFEKCARRHAGWRESAKQTLRQLMDVQGVTSLETELFDVTIRKGPPKITLDTHVVNVDSFPAEYLRVEKSINLQALLNDIRNNKPVPDGVGTKQETFLHLAPT